jgi:hypothetical protein
MTPNQYEVVEEDSPDRCQGVSARGQCLFRAVEGTAYCPMHGGTAARAFQVRQDQRKYKLAKWQDRVNEFADDDQLKSLNDEIGILRMTLEQVLLACHEATDMLLYAPKIADLVAKIEKLVVTCHKLEASTGVLLTRNAAFKLASQIVDIVARHVTDADSVAQIADEIGSAIANVKPDDIDL